MVLRPGVRLHPGRPHRAGRRRRRPGLTHRPRRRPTGAGHGPGWARRPAGGEWIIDPELLHQLATTPIRPALVTGAARGIGRAIAARLVRDGAPVVLLDRDPAVRQTAAELGATGWVVADVADPDDVRRAVADTLDCLGGLWALINNAGIFAKVPLLELDPAQWDEVMAVNARSVLLTTQAVAPAMIAAGGGRIVNLASMAAKAGTPGEAAYAASKAAVMALTRIAAAELGPHGITVNCVCPGYVLTDMGADTRTQEQIEEWSAQSPLGRCATPDDVAGVVAHLVSDDAAYQTAQALNVSGGMLAW